MRTTRLRNNETTSQRKSNANLRKGDAKQRDYEPVKEQCETTKGRCETTRLRNNEIAKQRKSDAMRNSKMVMRNNERAMRNNETAEQRNCETTKLRKGEMTLSGHHIHENKISCSCSRWHQTRDIETILGECQINVCYVCDAGPALTQHFNLWLGRCWNAMVTQIWNSLIRTRAVSLNKMIPLNGTPGHILSHKSQFQKAIEVKYVIFRYFLGRHLELHKKYYNLAIENSLNRFHDLLNVGLDTKIVFLSWSRSKICPIMNLWWFR